MQNLFSLLYICHLPHPALYTSLIPILSPVGLLNILSWIYPAVSYLNTRVYFFKPK